MFLAFNKDASYATNRICESVFVCLRVDLRRPVVATIFIFFCFHLPLRRFTLLFLFSLLFSFSSLCSLVLIAALFASFLDPLFPLLLPPAQHPSTRLHTSHLSSNMSIVSITQVNVLDNPTHFANPYQFEITFECIAPLAAGK